MSTIPASYIVAINPRLIPAGGTDLEFNGLFLTENTLIPTDAPLMEFTSAETVAAFFGETSPEYSAASLYFLGYNNSFAKPRRVMFARRVSAAAGAWLRGAKYTGTLAAVQAITSGTLNIEINSTTIALTNIDLSAATSYSDAAATLETALDGELTGVTVAFSSLTGAFQINSPSTGATETITYASGTIAELLNLTEATGAVKTNGSDALTQTANMNAIKAQSQNWVTFTTLYTAADSEHLGLAEWASNQGIEYLYVGWTNDARLLVQGGTSDIASQIAAAEYGATALVYDNINVAAFILGTAASINWNRYQGTITFAFKHIDGLAPTVTDETTAALLDEKGVGYVGKFATRNDAFTFFYSSKIFGRYGFIDTFINTVWLKNVMQVSIMNGLTLAGRVPYNERGYTLIRAWLQDPINRAVNNGAIDPGVTLSESQKAQVYNETGKDLTTELWTKGYAILVEDAGAAVRVGRNSPNISVYYTYGGSVHRVEVASTALV